MKNFSVVKRLSATNFNLRDCQLNKLQKAFSLSKKIVNYSWFHHFSNFHKRYICTELSSLFNKFFSWYFNLTKLEVILGMILLQQNIFYHHRQYLFLKLLCQPEYLCQVLIGFQSITVYLKGIFNFLNCIDGLLIFDLYLVSIHVSLRLLKQCSWSVILFVFIVNTFKPIYLKLNISSFPTRNYFINFDKIVLWKSFKLPNRKSLTWWRL